MGRPYTKEQASDKVIKICQDKSDYVKTLTFLGFVDDQWIGNTTKLILECSLHGKWETTSFNNFQKERVNCPECSKYSPLKKNKKEDIIQRIQDIYGNKYDLSKFEYGGFHTKSCFICHSTGPILKEEHGEFWMTPANLLNGHNCPKCSNTFRKDTDYFIKEVETIHGIGKFTYTKTKYINKYTKVIITCPIHGDFYTVPNYFLSKKYGCPLCKNSIGEELVYNHFNNSKIKFNTQVRIKGEIPGKRSDLVIIDFSLERNNQIYWIEFNGEQHYKFCEFFHNQSYQNFINQVNRDKAVREYALEHNIRFLEIPYLDIDRIPEILDAFLYDGLDITTKINPKILPTLWIKQN